MEKIYEAEKNGDCAKQEYMQIKPEATQLAKALIKKFTHKLSDNGVTASDSKEKAETCYMTARAEINLSQKEQGVQSLKKCVSLDVNHLGGCTFLANLMLELGAGKRCSKVYRNAIRRNKLSTASHIGLMLCVQLYADSG